MKFNHNFEMVNLQFWVEVDVNAMRMHIDTGNDNRIKFQEKIWVQAQK